MARPREHVAGLRPATSDAQPLSQIDQRSRMLDRRERLFEDADRVRQASDTLVAGLKQPAERQRDPVAPWRGEGRALG